MGAIAALWRNHKFYGCSLLLLIAAQLIMLRSFSLTYHPELLHSFLPMALANTVADAVLLGTIYWLLPQRRRWLFWTVVWAFVLWCLAQVVYDVSYGDVMPFSSFTFVSNAGNLVARSAWANVLARRAACLALLALPVMLYAAYRLWLRHGMDSASPRRWVMIAVSVAVFVAVRLAVPAFLVSPGEGYAATVKHLWGNTGARQKSYIYYNGSAAYALRSLWQSLPRSLSEKERREVEEFIAVQRERRAAPLDTADAGYCKNVLFVLVESLNGWAVDLDIDGQPVMPNLRRMAADSSAIVSTNVLSQAKNGRSSDGKFIYLTGLLPLMQESVAMSHPDGNYPSLVKVLKAKGYYCGEITVDQPGLWNVEQMSREYGFDTLINQSQLSAKFASAGWRLDEVVLREAAAAAENWEKPFFLMVFTGTTHSPYDAPGVETTWISRSSEYTPAVRNYLERAHYFDSQLGAMIKHLEDNGLLNSTLVVVASDHSEPVDDSRDKRAAICRNAERCALVIWGADKKPRMPEIMGQVDVYPTLLDVMRLPAETWPGLGTSVFRNHPCTAAASGTELRGTATGSAEAKRQLKAWDIAEKIILCGKSLTLSRQRNNPQ